MAASAAGKWGHAALASGTGAVGGFGALVMQHLAWRGLLDAGLKFRPMTLPDRFIDHDTPAKQYEEAGLNASGIVATVLDALGLQGEAQQAQSASRKPR